MSTKKIFVIAVITMLAVSSAFANFFSKRFFEVKVGTDVGFSNSLFTANELLKKNLVIDLPKLAAECPSTGFTVVSQVDPSLSLNINIAAFSLGIKSGVDVYGKVNMDKGFFEFLGDGNELDEPLDFGIKSDMDIFAYSELNVGLKMGKYMLYASPAVFLPVVSVRESGGVLTLRNDSDGSIHMAMNMDMNVYSSFSVVDNKGNVNMGMDSVSEIMNSGYGFDIGALMRIPIFSSLTLDAEARIPLIPGQLKKRTSYTASYSYDIKSIMEFGDAESNMQEPSFNDEESVSLSVNRPLKAALYLNKELLGSFLSVRAGGGLGIQRPFSDSYFIYPEYYLGICMNLVDILKFSASTAYKDQVFIHQLGTTVNIRFLQIDLGASLQSADFIKSCQGAGFGAYTYFTLGF